MRPEFSTYKIDVDCGSHYGNFTVSEAEINEMENNYNNDLLPKGWFDFEKELPPLNRIVIVTFPLSTYNGHFFNGFGKRVDEHFVFTDCNFKLSMKKGNIFLNPYVRYWAYWTKQNLTNICECPHCNPEKSVNFTIFAT